jgi:hypothetical protein
MGHSPNRIPRERDSATTALSAEEREGFLRFVGARLPDGDPLKGRIDRAVEILSQRLEQSVDPPTANEITETEAAAWRTIEAQRAVACLEAARIMEEFRRERVGRLNQLLPVGDIDPDKWSALQDEFRVAYDLNPEQEAWIYINESPPPAGPGGLHFRQLANRAAWLLAGVAGDDAWKSWLDVLVGYLLKNDPDGEYLDCMEVGHLHRPDGTTYETHPGVIMQGENYRISHLSKASELCCASLILDSGKRHAASGRTQPEEVKIRLAESRSASGIPVKDRTAPVHANAQSANPVRAAMRREGLNVPRLTAQVRAVLKAGGEKKLKVDRSTIYRLVNGQTKRPNPTIRRVVLDVLKMPVE